MRSEYDIVVVGAGPAGSVAARYAAQKGVSVLMLEKDRDVGYPVRCGEAVRKLGVEEFITPDKKWIAAEINKFAFISPDETEVIINFDETGYILERRIFDYELAKLAAKEGADILTRAYVNGLLFENNMIAGVKYEHQGEQKEVKAKIVIAADGVESRVGRWAGLKTHVDFRDMESCVQVTAANIDVDPHTCYFYLGEDVAPEGYFWVFPKSNSLANIGLGITGNIGKNKSALSYLNKFMQRKYPDTAVLTCIAGGVPFTHAHDKLCAPGIILTGDAARQANPLTGGGIGSGMVGGSIAGTIVADSILNNNPDHIFTYEKAWYEKLGKKYEILKRIKYGVYNFSDVKYNKIAHSFSKVPVEKRTLGNLFKAALFNNPSLLVDVAKVFINV